MLAFSGSSSGTVGENLEVMEPLSLDITHWSHRVPKKEPERQFPFLVRRPGRTNGIEARRVMGVKKSQDMVHGDSKGSEILRERERYGTGGKVQMKRHAGDGSKKKMETYSLHYRS